VVEGSGAGVPTAGGESAAASPSCPEPPQPATATAVINAARHQACGLVIVSLLVDRVTPSLLEEAFVFKELTVASPCVNVRNVFETATGRAGAQRAMRRRGTVCRTRRPMHTW
jgi:hypothetical protein